MIRFGVVSKIYPGQLQPAVRDLTISVPAGAICVLVGPSGCGKTTILKMTNRLIEPTSGTISIMGQNILDVDPVQLRRGIGYVIQQTGLFPHMTIYENIATVPRLLRWGEPRIRQRVDELLTLVGMDPGAYRDRYPRQLSGGQAQRVGVARALATDPPVMLMDEPFGALDPIAREHLQNEFLKIQRQIKKTILFVTHDIDEAIKMGNYLCILEDGQLQQFGAPEEILTRPATDFVDAFLGSGRTLRRLDLARVETVMTPADTDRGRPIISCDASLAEALSVMLADDVTELTVTNDQGAPIGVLSMATVRNVARLPRDAARTGR